MIDNVKSYEKSVQDIAQRVNSKLVYGANHPFGEFLTIESINNISLDDVINYYKKLISNYPIKSIEDTFAEEDWESWKKITNKIGKNIQIVGDDLFATNIKRLKTGI